MVIENFNGFVYDITGDCVIGVFQLKQIFAVCAIMQFKRGKLHTSKAKLHA